MILIADSGSSKTDWRFLSKNGDVEQSKTIGFNPFYQPQEQFDQAVKEVLKPQIANVVSEIYYYGAGCSNDHNKKIIHDVLQNNFKEARVEVQHDLLAAARSLCGNASGIACIVGTGTNSCYYDGQKITTNVPSLGYVLGDEGGGTYLGKRLISEFIRHELPKPIYDRFHKRFELDRNQLLHKIYQQERPGQFLASFSKFIFQNIKEPYCHRLVYDSFTLFFEKNILKYDEHKSHKVHFTGSVAFYYSNILRQVANDLAVSVGNIVETPIAGLTLFHQNEYN